MASTFVDTATVHDRKIVRDATGGSTSTFVPRSQVEACRFAALNDTDLEAVGELPEGKATSVVVLRHDLLIDEGALLVQPSGKRWSVYAIRTPPGNFSIATRIVVREL